MPSGADFGFFDRFGGVAGAAAGNSPVFGAAMPSPFTALPSPLAAGYGGMFGTGSYLGTLAAYSPPTSPFSIGLPPNLYGQGAIPVPGNQYLPVAMIPTGTGTYTYIPVGNPQPTADWPKEPAFRSTPRPMGLSLGGSPAGAAAGGPLGLSFGTSPDIFGGSAKPRAPEAGGRPSNQSQNLYPGRSLGPSTSPHGYTAASGGTRPISVDAPNMTGILGGAIGGTLLTDPRQLMANPTETLNRVIFSDAPVSPILKAPINTPDLGVPRGPQSPLLVNIPHNLTTGVQGYFAPGGQTIYTNPGQIGIPAAGEPGRLPGSTGFTQSGSAYYSTPPLGGQLPLGPEAQTLLGFMGQRVDPGTPGVAPRYFTGPSGAPGSPSSLLPGFPPLPSTAGPFAGDSPFGLAANLVTNEIMRREGLLNTAQQEYQKALGTITGSALAPATDALMSELISNPFPFSSEANKQAMRGEIMRRYGQGQEAAKAAVKQASTEAGLRGGEVAGLEASTAFKGSAALADALAQLEREFGAARVQERQAAGGLLGSLGQTLTQSVFGPRMEVASFFERRSNPEIQGLVRLLGQDMALKVAQAIAAAAQQPSRTDQLFGYPFGGAFSPLPYMMVNKLL